MRFFEFSSANVGPDKFELLLRNQIGQASSKHAPSFLNWAALSQLARANGFELAIDHPTFAAMYDANPELQQLISDFTPQGVRLNVPGTASAVEPGQQDGQSSQAKVDQMAASAAPKQTDQADKTPTPPPPPPMPASA